MSAEIFQKVWRTIVLAAFFLFAVYIPLQILYPGFHIPFSIWIINIIFISDTIYNFLSIRNKADEIQLSANYRKIFLFIDIIAAIPFGFITGNILYELIRFIKIVHIFNYMQDFSVRTIKLNSYLKFIFFLYLFLLVTHLLACGWIVLSEIRYYNAEEYVTSLYWCIQTLTTVGYGDVTHSDIHHKIYAMVVMLFGVGVYGFVIGNIANILLKSNPARNRFLDNLEKLRSFVNFRELPPALQKRIQKYYEYLWKERIGFNESEFIAGLPAGLKTEVELFLKRDILKKIPLFKGISDSFLREVSLYLHHVVYTPGDYIFRKGDRGDEMYFVIKGKLKILTGDENKIINTISDGDFFGELALFRNDIRMATVRAETYCDVYILKKEIFDRVLNFYPEISSYMKKIAEERLRTS